jgi:hypothetical protein
VFYLPRDTPWCRINGSGYEMDRRTKAHPCDVSHLSLTVEIAGVCGRRKVGGVLSVFFLEHEQRKTKAQGKETGISSYLTVFHCMMMYPIGDIGVEYEPALWTYF